MTIKTYREAVKEALAQEMERDERVVLIGEDLRGGHGGNATRPLPSRPLSVWRPAPQRRVCGRSRN